MKTQSSAQTWTWTLDFDLGFVNVCFFIILVDAFVQLVLNFLNEIFLNLSQFLGRCLIFWRLFKAYLIEFSSLRTSLQGPRCILKDATN